MSKGISAFSLLLLFSLCPLPAAASAAAEQGAGAGKENQATSEKGTEPREEKGMEQKEPTTAIDLSTLKTLTDVIREVAGRRIVYIGEYHDKYADHGVQLRMIQGLYDLNPRIAIGMEMFQRPFQKVVDDYINGVIDERAFLSGTEYFKRWVFDYNLYKPILDFARSRKIPVVALNQTKEIIDKVAKEGMDSLTEQQRQEVPADIDFSNNAYRERLKTVFDQHKGSEDKNFEFFYQAQLLWDETMAFSVDEYLRKNPDVLMVVIAGGGHVAHGDGIPKRALRRNGLPYSIVLNDRDVEKGVADYLVLAPAEKGPAAPKLMAVLKEDDHRVIVTGLPEDSPSRKAGIRVGDRILSLDNETVKTVEDVKLMLFYKKSGDTARVKIIRRRFLLGDKVLEFTVPLK
jgi:aminopeptidase N